MNKKLELNFTKKPEMVFQFDQFLNVEEAIEKFLNNKENLEKIVAPYIPQGIEEKIKDLIPKVEDGYTPVKGVDYNDGKPGYTPKKGVDYFDGKDGETPSDEKIISLIEPRIPKPIPGKNGTTPIKGIDYFTKKEIESLKKGLKEAILSEMPEHATKEEVSIKFEDIKKQINKLPQTGGAQFLRQLMDVNVGTPTAQQYGLTYNPQRSEFTLTAITGGGGAVDSVNGQTGVVVLDTDDISDTATNRYTNDTDITRLANTSGTNTGDQDLTPYFNKSLDDTDDITVGTTNKFATATEKTKLGYITVTQAVDLDQMEADIAALANGMVYKGNWDASAGTFPGSGSAQTGWFYTVSVGGTVDSVVFNVDDRLVATTDNASTTTYAGNWTQLDATDAVTSVFGRTGNVVSANGDYNAGQITNTPAGGISATDVQTAINELDTEKQATLVSGTNIKTINSTTLLGSGDLAVATTAQGALADSALQPGDIASGTITARADDINFSGGVDGDVLTVQADGSLALEAPASGGANTALSNLSGVAINTSLVSDTDNTDNIGSSLIRWATGFFTNLGATGTRIVKGWFTDIESTNMPTVGGTPILSSLTAPQFTTIELGAASDTTLSRSSAGNVAIEGNVIYRAGGTDVPVADGGTGVSSLTAYAVICGGTTSTGAVQSIASVGTTGQVLTSNGAGALPTFQTAAGAPTSAVRAYRTTSVQTVSTGFASRATVQFNAESFDVDGEFDTGTYTFTPATTGKYQLNIHIGWASWSANTTCELYVVIGGSEKLVKSFDFGGSGAWTMDYSDLITLTATSGTVSVKVAQYTGGNRDISTGEYVSNFSIKRVS